MNSNLQKTLVSGLVALTAIATLAAAPTQAKPFPHPHHGFGRWGVGGLIGGLALGALAVSTASSYDCGTIRQAEIDQYGNIVGYRYVPAC